MKKTWQKPEFAATGKEVTSYASVDIDSEIIIDPEVQLRLRMRAGSIRSVHGA